MFEIRVEKNIISVQSRETMIAGSSGVNQCHFTFTEDWEDFFRSAIFRVGTLVLSVPLKADDTCELPWELLVGENIGLAVEVSAYGAKSDIEILPTAWDRLGRVRGGAEPGRDPRTPTPSMYASFAALMNSYKTAVEAVLTQVEALLQETREQAQRADQSEDRSEISAYEAQRALQSIRAALDRLPGGKTPIINSLTTGGAGAALSAAMGRALALRRGRNLLDNSSFASIVNQRGLTTYEGGEHGHCLDRWRRVANLKVTVGQRCIQLENQSQSAVCTFSQYVPGEDAPQAGDVVTLAFEDTGGMIRAASWTVPAVNPSEDTVLDSEDYSGAMLRLAVRTTGMLQVGVALQPQKAVSLRWAALYRGAYTVDTLPPYEPKGYGAELAECQRYYQKPLSTGAIRAGNVLAGENGQMTFAVPTPCMMRTGVSIAGTPQIRGISAQSATDGFSFSVLGQSPGYITVLAKKADHGMTDAILRPSGMVFTAEPS